MDESPPTGALSERLSRPAALRFLIQIPCTSTINYRRLALQHDDEGDTPMIAASRKGHLHTLQCLLENGGDVGVENDFGRTALHVASIAGHVEACLALLRYGADLFHRWVIAHARYTELLPRPNGRASPTHIVALSPTLCLPALRSFGSVCLVLACRDKNECTPLCRAVVNGQKATAVALAIKGGG